MDLEGRCQKDRIVILLIIFFQRRILWIQQNFFINNDHENW